MRTAERLSERLAAHGVHDLFGNPGTTELPFLADARHQRYYLTLHDALAVGAADGFAQAGRCLGAANLHAAPGLGNSIGFLETAQRNRSPLLVTVGQQDLRHVDQRPLLYGDLKARTDGLVKFFHELRAPSELPEAVDRAVRIALEPPMGPVLLSLPMNVLELDAGGPPTSPLPPAPDPGRPAGVDEIVERLRSAERPALVVGYEVDVFDAFEGVRNLARCLGAPVYAEPVCSRAPIPVDFDAFAGDLLPATAMIDSALADFDLVALVGADLTLYPYTGARLLPGRPVVYLGADPSVPEKLGAVGAIGDLAVLLRDLVPRLPARGPPFHRPPDFARSNRIARAAARLGGEFVLDAVRRAFGGYSLVDESVSLIPTLKSVGFYAGPLSYFASRSQQLGWGLAAAIGIALRRPKTVVVLGDGALQYSVPALWTLARYRIPAKIVVVNNAGYSILKSYAKANHPSALAADYLEVPGIDVVALSRAYGVPASRVESADRLDLALAELREATGPALLDVAVDRAVPDLFS